MSLHTDLPIYKTGCDLLSMAFVMHARMPRAFKKTVGEKVHVHCFEILDLMVMANANRRERAKHIEAVLTHQRALSTLLRVSFDMKLISPKLWASSIQLLDSIGRQAGGWLKSSRDKAPAA